MSGSRIMMDYSEREKLKTFFVQKDFLEEFDTEEKTGEIWLDPKEGVFRTQYRRVYQICMFCEKEIKIWYDVRREHRLITSLEGKLCPNCNNSNPWLKT